mgnify:FL=1
MGKKQTAGAGFIEVEAPDGSIIEFPDSMSDQDVASAMQRLYPPTAPLGKTQAPTPQAPTSVGGGGASPIGQATSSAPQQPLSVPDGSRLPTRESDAAAFAFNSAALAGDEFQPKTPQEAAIAVVRDRIAKVAAPARKKAPYVDVAQQQPEPSAATIEQQQYTPEYIAQKKEAGMWTPADQFRYDEVQLRNEASMLRARRQQLAERVDASGTMTPEDEREAMQLEVQREGLVERQKANILAFESSPEEVIKRRMQERSDKEFKRAQGYIEKGDWVRPEVVEHAVVRPAINSLADFAMNAVGGTARLLDTAGNLPNTVTGDGQYYSPLAKFADFITEGGEYRSATEASKTKEDLFDDDWNFNGKAALPQLVRTGVQMAGLMGAGAYGGRSAMGAASFLTTEEDYYREAIDAGLTPKEASRFSIPAASMTAFLEGVNPNLYGGGTAKGALAQKALVALKNGKTTKDAIKDGAQFVVSEIGGENAQEFAQAAGDLLARYAANESIGDDKLDATMSAQDAAQIAVLTTAMTGLVAGAAKAKDRPIYDQAIEWAVRNPEEMTAFIEKAVPEGEREKVMAEFDRQKKAHAGVPPEVTGAARTKVAAAVAEKERIKEEQAQTTVDETVAAAIGNQFDERIKEQDAIIANELGIDLVELAKVQEAKRLQE